MKPLLTFALLLAAAASLRLLYGPGDFADTLAAASLKSSLILPGSQPFHMKLHAEETQTHDPDYTTDIEVWWAAPHKWRREVKSGVFSQTAAQNGAQYNESNSSDYLPWWLHELIQESVDPIPVADLKNEDVDYSGSGCAKWESQFQKDGQKVTEYNSACFSPDNLASELFTRTIAVHLNNYRSFGKKQVARSLTVWPQGAREIHAEITSLEPFEPDDARFSVTADTGFASRVRFVSVPETLLVRDPSDVQPIQWPPVYNFPNTGVVTIGVKIDRNGGVREIGTVVSPNVLLVDFIKDQVSHFKFKPYLSDGVPVEVNTNLVLRFDSKVEPLGANGKHFDAISFTDHIKKSRELSEPRTDGATPFSLHATFKTADGSSGTYDETWVSSTKWRREAKLGGVSVLQTQLGDNYYRKVAGADSVPPQLTVLLAAVSDPFPDKQYTIYESDWGQSAVQFAGVDTVRVARGRVDAQNQPVDGSAFWFDPDGLMLGAFNDSTTVTYSRFEPWEGKRVPRTFEFKQNGNITMTYSIDRLEAAPSDGATVQDSTFVIEGVEPTTGELAKLQAAGIVRPTPLRKVAPADPHAGHGTVIVIVRIDDRGHVTGAGVQQSGGQALDAAALAAAKQWEFSPGLNNGKPSGSFFVIRFAF
jgi:TonB family protein